MISGRASGWHRSIAAIAVAMAVTGCAEYRLPRIDPTGEAMFIEPACAAPMPCAVATPAVAVAPCQAVAAPVPVVAPSRVVRTSFLADDDIAVTLSPYRAVAPIGSEVVMIAGVKAADGYLRTNRRLEWSLGVGSVGGFVAVGATGVGDFLLGDFNRPRIINRAAAVGSTMRGYELVGKSPNPADRVRVVRGQGWITVASPVEGTTCVSVVAPEVVVPQARRQTATIYWIDAQYGFPPPSLDPAGGSRVLTTTVLRQSNQSPRAGWIVRYEIVGGPAAQFDANGAQSIEVPTDMTGHANAEIRQAAPAAGTNSIRVQVFRPADQGTERIAVGSGSTLKTWTGPSLAVQGPVPSLSVQGPAPSLSIHVTALSVAAVGAMIDCRIDISNPGDAPVKNATVSEELPPGLTLVSATPQPASEGTRLVWQLGDVAGRQQTALNVKLQVMQPGTFVNCAEVTAAGGVRANHCATTTVFSPALDVTINGPTTATVGSPVRFEVVVTNRSQVPVRGLIIRDRFGDGFVHAEARSPIERSFGDLAPGQARAIALVFQVVRPGQLCHTVEIVAADGTRASREACLTATAAGSSGIAPAPVGPGPAAPPAPEKAPAAPVTLAVKVAGPREATVGATGEYVIQLTNTGSQTLTNIRVLDEIDPAIVAEHLTEGSRTLDRGYEWTIPEIGAGITAEMHLQCRFAAPALRAGHHVTITLPTGQQAKFDSPDTAIREAPAAAPSRLSIGVVCIDNPSTINQPVRFSIQVKNEDAAAASGVVVSAAIPVGATADPLHSNGPGGISFETVGDRIVFRPLGEIAAGQTVNYRIGLQMSKAGKYSLRVEAQAGQNGPPFTGETNFEVLER